MFKQSLALIGLTLSLGANAALIDNGTFTTDTVSGLDWLDLSATANLHYHAVTSQMGVGQAFEGWIYATEVQVSTLLDNAGGSGTYGGYSAAHNSVAPLVIGLLGATDSGTGASAQSSQFILADTVGSYHRISLIRDFDNGNDFINLHYSAFLIGQRSLDVSSALVRVSTVPIPAAAWLFGSALLGLGALKRFKT